MCWFGFWIAIGIGIVIGMWISAVFGPKGGKPE